MKCAPVKRKYSKLPVWIVEDHHDVVPHIYRAIASRHIPAKDVKMVHLDSHPDLLIPVSMPAHHVFDKEALFSELSIENWIMPMVFAGHVSHVAWLHPHWAQQIREGEHVMSVGRDKSTGTIRVTSTDDYFLSDALYVPPEQLEEAKPLRLSVIRVDPVDDTNRNGNDNEKSLPKKSRIAAETAHPRGNSSCSEASQAADGSSLPGNSRDCTRSQREPSEGSSGSSEGSLLNVIDQGDPYILDIDLDFFSCKNPFKEMYTQEEYSILQDLYSFKRPRRDANEEELCECVERRTQQLEELEAAFADLLDDDTQLVVERWAAKPGMEALTKLVCSLKRRHESPAYEMVHQAGLTCDYSELPHHISSDAEIQQLLHAVQLVLQVLPKPTIVTMSRSSLDEYCPPQQVDSIQSGVMDILETLYGPLDVHKEYGEASSESASQSS